MKQGRLRLMRSCPAVSAGNKRQASNGSLERRSAMAPAVAEDAGRPPGRLFSTPQWTGGASFISPASRLAHFSQTFISAAACPQSVGDIPAGEGIPRLRVLK